VNRPADPVVVEHARLTPLSFRDLPGFDDDDHAESWKAFRASCVAIAGGQTELRLGRGASLQHVRVCKEALILPEVPAIEAARAFYERAFTPCLIEPNDDQIGQAAERAFFTAYYRPEVAASLTRSPQFQEPIFGRPADLITLGSDGDDVTMPSGLTGARRAPDGRLAAYPTRSEIDMGALGPFGRPIAYAEDAIEAFMIQVQGSARIRLADGQRIDLTYAGRNGHPYVSIGKILIRSGEIAPSEMSLDVLKSWVRSNGQQLGEPGRKLLHRNPSFIFFSGAPADDNSPGSIGAAGVPLKTARPSRG
jgi:membrane-bound lytic murein transglycosylase A